MYKLRCMAKLLLKKIKEKTEISLKIIKYRK